MGDKRAIFVENSNIVRIGSLIKFNRYDRTYFGIVRGIRGTSVLVAIDSNVHSMGMYFDVEKGLTVVNHANYDIVAIDPNKYITDLELQYLYGTAVAI